MSNSYKAGRVAQVFGVQLQNKFPGEQIRFHFLLTVVHSYQISVFSYPAIDMGLMTFYYVCISDGAERLPPLLPHGGWLAVFYRPALPGVSESAIRRTHLSRLRRGHSGLPLLTIHGPRLGHVRGQCDDTLRPHGVVVRVLHR
jgi:hypothetical protein